MKTITVLNQKGGVGKTTTATNLAHAMALQGQRVLAIDLDPQAQLGASLGVGYDIPGVDQLLLDNADIMSLCQGVRDNLTLLPTGFRLGQVESALKPSSGAGFLLKSALDKLTGYDAVVIDCPPSSGVLVVNALFAADELLITVPGDYLSLHGMSYLMGTLRQFEAAINRKLVYWVAITRYQPRRRLAAEVLEKLKEYFPGRILATVIKEAVVLAECPGMGKSIFDYKRSSPSASEYLQLAQDLTLGRVLA